MHVKSIRRTAKSIRDFLLSTRVMRGANPPPDTLTILTYHRILPHSVASSGLIEPGMYVTPETFDMHLTVAKQYFTPIRLTDWLQLRDTDRQADKRYIALTIDDGWRDNYEFAFRKLSKHAFPATVFLVPNAVEQKLMFWSDRLAVLYRNRHSRKFFGEAESVWIRELGVNAAFFDRDPNPELLACLVQISKQLPDEAIKNELARIEDLGSEMLHSRDAERHFMDWEEIGSMADSGLVDFGSHSTSHIRLDFVTDEAAIDAEVLGSRETLKEKLGEAFCDVFCYPNGGVSDLAENRVREHYAAACTTVRGVNLARDERYRLRRIGVHEDATASKRSFLSNLIRY